MDELKPYSTLYKKRDGTELKSECEVLCPSGKTIELRSGDPTTNGNTTLIRYDVVGDPSQMGQHTEEDTQQFPWYGELHYVRTEVIEYGEETGNNNKNSAEAHLY